MGIEIMIGRKKNRYHNSRMQVNYKSEMQKQKYQMAEQDRDLPAAHFCMTSLNFDWFYKGFDYAQWAYSKCLFYQRFNYFLQIFVPSCTQIGKDSVSGLI